MAFGRAGENLCFSEMRLPTVIRNGFTIGTGSMSNQRTIHILRVAPVSTKAEGQNLALRGVKPLGVVLGWSGFSGLDKAWAGDDCASLGIIGKR
jgi:hypothetical protein